MKHLELVRKMVQEKIPDKKVRNVWFISIDIQDNILYGISGNNNKFFAVAKISPTIVVLNDLLQLFYWG